MLQHTFIHVPGVGRVTEQRLWDHGIRTWSDVSRISSAGLNRSMTSRLQEFIPRSERALANRDASFFSSLASVGEAWRLYEAFSDSCVYLDIETTGLSSVFNTLTVVGLYDGSEYRLFVDGRNLDELPKALERYAMVVTFNGSQFDLPFLQATFPGIALPPIHIDLRWLTRKLGHSGGLKNIEAKFGLRRASDVATLSGFDATVLWSRFLRGDDAALQLLIRYNTEDVVNLKTIMERSYETMAKTTAAFAKPKTVARTASRKLPLAANGMGSVLTTNRAQPVLVKSLLEQAAARGNGTRIVGIDLTGSEKRASGWALLDGNTATTRLISSDAELITETLREKPDLVSIDSPLSLPGGLTSVADCKRHCLPIYRACELALKRMGISVFWCLLPSMTSLTIRGMTLARAFREAGVSVIESYPGAAQDLLRIPRKGTSLEELKWGLSRSGIEGDFVSKKVSHDEIDAITSALVGLFYAADEYLALGNALEDYLIVPRSPQVDYRRLAAILKQSGLDAMPGDVAPDIRPRLTVSLK